MGAPNNTLNIADLDLADCASHFVLDRNITAIWYIAPEVLLHIKQLDFLQSAFDMWSYGVVMCALLCGTHMFCIPSKTRKDKEEIKVLQKQIDLLGPPDWHGIKELPTWSEYAQHLQIEESGVSTDLREKLASTKFVKRPLGSLEIDMLEGLFRWCPSSRMTAVDAGSHTYWSAASQHTSEKTVGGCSLSSQASGTEAGVPPFSSQASIETLSLGESGVSADPPQGLLLDDRKQQNSQCSLNCGNTWCERAKKQAARLGKKVGGVCGPSSQANGAEACVPPLSSRASIETLSLGESGVSAAPPQGLLQDGRVARLGKNRVCSNAALPGASHCLQGLQVR